MENVKNVCLETNELSYQTSLLFYQTVLQISNLIKNLFSPAKTLRKNLFQLMQTKNYSFQI